ncbi:hypothetical protein IQ227_00915 [Anabaena aphanizomenioides LEGE 00250]|jgi:hypothetical protein|uniref:Uncharacterized protein n=1 Tax=Sphaerospermopsis aphanizomenoides LEGE 00250 TaxID=2777972 RepID=A0ABR9VA68_9CYAN|nr:hypothetical protein [Sphaerospermopsis aphanizomenoides]MBE9234632.1 hypothetical protein [Sphaerospermopsis aphanizomenoides LEGE 00250]
MAETKLAEDLQIHAEGSEKPNKFQKQLNNLDFKKNGVSFNDIVDIMKTAIADVVELEIETSVFDASLSFTDESQTAKPENRLLTRINLIDGDIKNEVGSKFIGDGPYAELREFHLSQVKESREIIQKNIESIQKLYEILMAMLKHSQNNQNSQPSKRP